MAVYDQGRLAVDVYCNLLSEPVNMATLFACGLDLFLDPLERQVTVLRYGIENGKPRTADEACAYLGLSQQRVNEIELKVIRKFSDLLSQREIELPK